MFCNKCNRPKPEGAREVGHPQDTRFANSGNGGNNGNPPFQQHGGPRQGPGGPGGDPGQRNGAAEGGQHGQWNGPVDRGGWPQPQQQQRPQPHQHPALRRAQDGEACFLMVDNVPDGNKEQAFSNISTGAISSAVHKAYKVRDAHRLAS